MATCNIFVKNKAARLHGQMLWKWFLAMYLIIFAFIAIGAMEVAVESKRYGKEFELQKMNLTEKNCRLLHLIMEQLYILGRDRPDLTCW